MPQISAAGTVPVAPGGSAHLASGRALARAAHGAEGLAFTALDTEGWGRPPHVAAGLQVPSPNNARRRDQDECPWEDDGSGVGTQASPAAGICRWEGEHTSVVIPHPTQGCLADAGEVRDHCAQSHRATHPVSVVRGPPRGNGSVCVAGY